MSEEVIREVSLFGTIRYYNKANQLHRLDGPATEYSDGSQEWWIEGKYYRTEEEWLYARCPSVEEAAAMFKELQS